MSSSNFAAVFFSLASIGELRQITAGALGSGEFGSGANSVLSPVCALSTYVNFPVCTRPFAKTVVWLPLKRICLDTVVAVTVPVYVVFWAAEVCASVYSATNHCGHPDGSSVTAVVADGNDVGVIASCGRIAFHTKDCRVDPCPLQRDVQALKQRVP